MSESSEHNPLDHEDPLPGPTWIIGILGAVLLAVVILGVTALFFNADARTVDEKVTEKNYPQFESLKAEQLAKLQGRPRIVETVEDDKVVQNVVIPINDAMAKFAERAAKEQHAAAAAVPSDAHVSISP